MQLETSQGTDITEAYETHHIRKPVDEVLQKYYIRAAKTPRNSPFTFKEDGFYKTLKKAVREELKKIPPNTSKKSDMITDGLFTSLLLTSFLACWVQNYWISTWFSVIASFSMAWLNVAAHNYNHQKPNWRKYLYNFSLYSCRDTRITHALSHHLYTNTLMDVEISAFEPLICWNPRRDKPLSAKFAIIVEMILFPFLCPMTHIKKLYLIYVRKGFFEQHYRWHDCVGYLLPIWMFLASGCSLYMALTTWLWIVCTGSFILGTIGTNAAHHHPDVFKDGDQVLDFNPDWGLHTLNAVMDRTDINSNIFTVLTFFGNHVLHHLFPSLDHALLSHLYPVFLEHCQKYRANYKLSSSLDLFIGQIKSTIKCEPNVLSN